MRAAVKRVVAGDGWPEPPTGEQSRRQEDLVGEVLVQRARRLHEVGERLRRPRPDILGRGAPCLPTAANAAKVFSNCARMKTSVPGVLPTGSGRFSAWQ